MLFKLINVGNLNDTNLPCRVQERSVAMLRLDYVGNFVRNMGVDPGGRIDSAGRRIWELRCKWKQVCMSKL